MSGEILGLGRWHVANLGKHREWTFPGGFLTIGDFIVHGGGHMEGQIEEDLARQWQVQCALPDDATVIGLQCAKTLRRVYLRSVKGLRLLVPNDIFNQGRRIYVVGNEEVILTGPSEREELLETGTGWITIDDCLGVVGLYGAEQLLIFRPGRRNIKNYARGGIQVGDLHAEEICYPIQLGVMDYDADVKLYDIGFAVIAGADRHQTAAFNCKVPRHDVAGLRALDVTGVDGRRYLLLANMTTGNIQFEFDMDPGLEAVSLKGDHTLVADAAGRLRGACDAFSAELFCLSAGVEQPVRTAQRM